MAASPSPDALPGLAVLEQTPIIIEKIIWAANEDQLHWKPAMDRWSISEVLAHLADVEVMGFRERVQKMLDEKNPALLITIRMPRTRQASIQAKLART